MTLLFVILGISYLLVACVVFGVAITIENDMNLSFIIIGALLWPVVVAVGLGVSAAKDKR